MLLKNSVSSLNLLSRLSKTETNEKSAVQLCNSHKQCTHPAEASTHHEIKESSQRNHLSIFKFNSKGTLASYPSSFKLCGSTVKQSTLSAISDIALMGKISVLLIIYKKVLPLRRADADTPGPFPHALHVSGNTSHVSLFNRLHPTVWSQGSSMTGPFWAHL